VAMAMALVVTATRTTDADPCSYGLCDVYLFRPPFFLFVYMFEAERFPEEFTIYVCLSSVYIKKINKEHAIEKITAFTRTR
jgi:hypothetical protein